MRRLPDSCEMTCLHHGTLLSEGLPATPCVALVLVIHAMSLVVGMIRSTHGLTP